MGFFHVNKSMNDPIRPILSQALSLCKQTHCSQGLCEKWSTLSLPWCSRADEGKLKRTWDSTECKQNSLSWFQLSLAGCSVISFCGKVSEWERETLENRAQKGHYLAAVPVLFKLGRSVAVERRGELCVREKRPSKSIVTTSHWRGSIWAHCMWCYCVNFWGIKTWVLPIWVVLYQFRFSIEADMALFAPDSPFTQNLLVCPNEEPDHNVSVWLELKVFPMYWSTITPLTEYSAWPWRLVVLNSDSIEVLHCPFKCVNCRCGQVHPVQLRSLQQEGCHHLQRSKYQHQR